jgi:hypothetical protein
MLLIHRCHYELIRHLINSIIYQVPWEDKLEPGPVGEYIEVVDYDPTTGKYYKPVDLNNINIVARDGVDPGENNPQFSSANGLFCCDDYNKKFRIGAGP